MLSWLDSEYESLIYSTDWSGPLKPIEDLLTSKKKREITDNVYKIKNQYDHLASLLLKYPGGSWYFVSQLEKNIHEIKNKFPRIYKKVFPIQRVAGLEFTHDDNQKLVNCLTFMLKGLGEINSLTTYSQTFASTIEKNKRQFTTHVNDVKYNELCRALSIATKRLNKQGANLLEGEERLLSICQRAEMLFTRLLKESMGETDIPYGNGQILLCFYPKWWTDTDNGKNCFTQVKIFCDLLQGLGVSSTPKLKIDPKVQAAQKQLVDVLSNVCQAQAQYHHRRQKETSYNSIMSWNEDNLKGYLDQDKNYLITLKQESRDCLNKHLGKVFALLKHPVGEDFKQNRPGFRGYLQMEDLPDDEWDSCIVCIANCCEHIRGTSVLCNPDVRQAVQKALKNDDQASEITKFLGRILGEEIVDEVYNIFRFQTCSITQRKLMITANEEAGGDITSAGAESSLGQVLGPPIGANFNMKMEYDYENNKFHFIMRVDGEVKIEAVCSDMAHAYLNKVMSPSWAWFLTPDDLYESCKNDMYKHFKEKSRFSTVKDKQLMWKSTSDKAAICSGEPDIAAISGKPASLLDKFKSVFSTGVNKDVALRRN